MQDSFTPQNDPLISRVDKWSIRLLIIIAIIPIIVWFGALKDLALANSVNSPFMYSLMFDLSLIILNLIVLRSSLYGERNRYAWLLVVIATAISVMLIVVNAPRTALAMFMDGLPPLFILFAFHLVLIRIEQSAKRNQAVTSNEHPSCQEQTAKPISIGQPPESNGFADPNNLTQSIRSRIQQLSGNCSARQISKGQSLVTPVAQPIAPSKKF